MLQQTYNLAYVLPLTALFVLMVGLFWWVVIRPERKRARDHVQLVGDVRVGDDIVTAGGIHGTVTALHDKTVEVRVADKTVLTFDRYAIRKRQ